MKKTIWKMAHPAFRRSGFTLIELLVVISIIGILLGVTLPLVGRAVARSREAQCSSQIRQLALGALSYARDHRGRMPPLGGATNFVEHLTDYVGTATTARTSVWRCPADNRAGVVVSYGVNRLHLSAAEATNGWALARIQTPTRVVMMADSGGAAGPVWDLVFDASAAPKEVGVEFRHGSARGNQSVPAGSAAVFGKSRANFAFYDGHVEGLPVHSLTVTNWYE
ncbi:MAG: type II secretion system protein [Kiritimatiellia bacterium]|nr:type II secretion system protein [Kiritimatiellia bacterium]